MVGSRTARRPEAADAAVLQIPEAGNAIAVAIDGNGRRVACDPYAGTVEAVLECLQNLACVGAEPLGLTNCLNFGNPEKPPPPGSSTAPSAASPTPARCSACRWWGATSPFTTRGRTARSTRRRSSAWSASCRTPHTRPGSGFSGAGDAIALVGPFAPDLAGSELAKQRGALAPGLPAPDIEAVERAALAVREAARAGQLASAHDVSDGGLAAALAESAISGGVGVSADLGALLEVRGVGAEEALFGEGAGGFLLSGDREHLLALAGDEVDVLLLGETGGAAIEISAAETRISVPLAEAERAWRSLSI